MRHLTTLAALLMLMLPLHKDNSANAQTQRQEVLLETTDGNIRIALYNETPVHRDNFIMLVQQQLYDSLLFHRTIPDFMIQTGDTDSKHALPEAELGEGSPDYTLPAEIRLPGLYHKRGAVAAAREGDDVNPEWRSSSSQFYIVYGRQFSDTELDRYAERLDTLTQGKTKMTEEMRETYRDKGGTPHLDGTYTVFGEVTDGMDVVERIQKTVTDANDRPLKDIRILRATVIERPATVK